jgi:hypothetical protein
MGHTECLWEERRERKNGWSGGLGTLVEFPYLFLSDRHFLFTALLLESVLETPAVCVITDRIGRSLRCPEKSVGDADVSAASTEIGLWPIQPR